MADRGFFGGKRSTPRYTEEQVEAVLEEIGIDVDYTTATNFLCFCPFHDNTDSAAFSVEKKSGLFKCFNSSCDTSGNLITLVMKMTDYTYFPALRLVSKHEGEIVFEKKVLSLKPEEFPEYDAAKLEVQQDQFWKFAAPQRYMKGRGFDRATMEKFGVGYARSQGLVTIPMHDSKGRLIGVIGRSLEGKSFKNNPGLPTSKTLFNLHRAKRAGSTVIVVESATDVMRMDQFGIHNVVATCGGFFTEQHKYLVEYHFDTVVIGTDVDELNFPANCKKCGNECQGHNPGRALGEKIASVCSDLRVRWLAHSYGVFYPHNAKDPGDLTKEEIVQCIDNKITTAEYNRWKMVFPDLARV